MKLVVLLPPSQRKTSGGENPPIQPNQITKQLLTEIHEADPEKLYSARKEEAQELNDNIETAKTKPAIQRYSGVLYKALDYNTLNDTSWVDEHVRIISPLFGILRATDDVPNYKFRISKLQAYKKWKEHNTNHLKESYVIDLLSTSYAKSITYKGGERIEFTKTKNGKTVKAGHSGKKIKGKYVRWLAQNNITDPEKIYDFQEDGYSWNGKAFHKP